MIRLIETVPYNSQRDNELNPYGACNVTCLTMLLNYYGFSIKDDELMKLTRSEEVKRYAKKIAFSYYKTNYNWYKAIIKYIELNKLNIVWFILQYVGNLIIGKDYLVYDDSGYNYRDIITNIENAKPVMLSGKFTKSGHIVLCIGYVTDDETGNLNSLVFHDPYGNYNTSYRDHNGEKVIYSKFILDNILNFNVCIY